MFHFGSGFKGCTNLDKRALADAGAPAGGVAPIHGGLDQFGPERKEAALGRFGGVDGAALGVQEGTLPVWGFAETKLVACPVDVLLLERGGTHVEEACGAAEIVLSEVDEAFLVAAARAAGLAFKADGDHGTPGYWPREYANKSRACCFRRLRQIILN